MGIIEKYKEMPIPAKASIWYTLCNILQKGISFIVIPIYTRVLSTSEYGRYSVFQSWRDILIIFATLNLYCGVFTKAMVDYEEDKDRYTSSMQGLSTVLTVTCLVIYIAFSNFWNDFFELDTSTMLLMFGYFLVYPAFSFWSVRKRVENKYFSMVVVTLIVSVATPMLSLFLLYYTNLREYAVIRGYLLIQCIVGLWFYIYQFVKGKKFFVKKYWLHGLRFNIPLMPHYLSLIILGQSDRIMIQKICGEDKAGIYSLAHQLSTLMNVIINSINGAFVPWFYLSLKRENYQSIRSIANKLCILMATMTIGLTLIAPEIILLLGTQEYMEAIWIIPAISLSVFYIFAYNLFCNIEFYYGQTQYVMLASVVGATLNIGLNAIFISIFGFIAAGYTTAFCYLIFMMAHYLFMRKICKEQGIETNIFDNKFIALVTVGTSIFSFVSLGVYNFTGIRYIIVVFIIIILFLKREKIILLMKEKK